MGRYMTPDPEWAGELVGRYPAQWADKLLEKWRAKHGNNRTVANLAHLKNCKAIDQAQRAGIKADANDNDICQEASESARDMARRIEQRDIITAGDMVAPVSPWFTEWEGRVAALAQFSEALEWLDARGLQFKVRGAISSFIRRVKCERWWRRVLRRVHSRAVESVARRIGLVHKRAGCYVSDDSLKRRRGQVARNQAGLEAVQAVNEHGQAYTLAELAAKGAANKEVRRHELMTRIAGFELIAKECGHAAYFVTVTCPSRMHAFRKKGEWAVDENPKHDGTAPDEAQAYLSKQWQRARAAAGRAGLDWYGFRIAEPNHDGTPHWHMLFFFDPVAVGVKRTRPAYRVLVRVLRRYFLWNDSGSERGARANRVDVRRIDWTRGSAAGYIAKYVAKNIDGYKVEKDLYGNDCMTASQRVEAWAATWRVRQFQQIGGAPVGVWREMRRLHTSQAGFCDAVDDGLQAVNRAAQEKAVQTEQAKRYTAANGWADYLRLQGGPRVPRRLLKVKVLKEQTGELGRYGDLMAAKPVGVVTTETVVDHIPAFGIVPAFHTSRVVTVEVESERSDWIIVPRGTVEGLTSRVEGFARSAKATWDIAPQQHGGGRNHAHVRGVVNEAFHPWSPVNNCTRHEWGIPDVHPERLFGPSVERSFKRGRHENWARMRASDIDFGSGGK